MSDTTHFGFKEIPVETKQGRVNDVFRSVANRYDLMNDIMSFGLHRAWKNMFVARLRVPLNRPFLCLDIAGGTGDIAFRILRDGGEQTRVTILDINPAMLEEGRRRAPEEFLRRLQFIQGNAEHLPFADDTFDACTIAFGIRNVPRIDTALTEARRVLKPGGHFLCLEFSTVEVPLLDRLYEFYSLKVIPKIGGMVTGD
ncbi:MAG: class I SAM-dependent methyltransferase, partial [Methylobacteriaceae bacterium]|nr:class I SAM-dependent methyltransferase [Methylobacteriaceae bacterium]